LNSDDIFIEEFYEHLKSQELKEWVFLKDVITDFYEESDISKSDKRNANSTINKLTQQFLKSYKEDFEFKKYEPQKDIVNSKKLAHRHNAWILRNVDNEIIPETISKSKEFVELFFNNLDEPQKYIIEKLLEDKMESDKKIREVYKDFENKFIELKNLTEKKIMLSAKINQREMINYGQKQLS
jgi:hypothetical protein